MHAKLLVLILFPFVVARGPFNTLGDIFQHQLANLEDEPPYTRPPEKGGMSIHYCCLKAVNESLEIQDGFLQFRPGQTHLRGTVSDLLRYQFPCGASYNGSIGSPSQVFLSYRWCHQNCPGWMIAGTSYNALTDWARQLVVFIVPSVIFSLTVARRRRLFLPQEMFARQISTVFDAFTLVYRIPLASILATIDVILWLIVVVTMAGPMIISGLYEALLDYRILKFIAKKLEVNSMTVKERAHILLLVLVGNLDYHPAWEHSRRLVSHLPHDSLRSRFSPKSTSIGSELSPLSPLPSLMARTTIDTTSQTSTQSGSESRAYPHHIQVHINSVGTQLRSLLEAQVSFGTSVGAAVLFYTVSFVYSLIELSGNYGNSGVAHSIAFGVFWMVVPHVSIVSSLLLASNNPGAWAAATAADQRAYPLTASSFDNIPVSTSDEIQATGWKRFRWIKIMGKHITRTLFPCMYETTYTPAWLWNRGESKSSWLRRYVEEYPNLKRIDDEILHMDFAGSLNILGSALFLLIAPAFMAGMISYTTPAVGLSCKSMTHLVYAAAQTLLSVVWLYKLSMRHNRAYVASMVSRTHRYARLCRDFVWYLLFILGLAAAFFTSILGTVFNLMGLYNNCLCYLPIWYWRSRYTSPEAEFYVGGNSIEKNYNAKHYWMPVGVSATALLIGMSYIGWWYQRHHRRLFSHLAENIGNINEQDMNENDERGPTSVAVTLGQLAPPAVA